MINDWSYKPVAIVESDDTCDRWDRNGMNFLFYWKTKYPYFKITLFTIPERTSETFLALIDRLNEYMGHYLPWIEVAVHGWNHESNFECYGWDYDKTMRLMERVEGFDCYKKIFKSPGWTITPGYNGYPADENAPISKDKQAVYKALTDRGYWIVDRHYNHEARPENSKIICIDDQTKFVHMHTWDMETGDKAGRNGYKQVEEEKGVPWDNNTEFYFISEAIEKGLITPCQK